MTITRNQGIALGVAAVLIAVVFLVGGHNFRGCGCAREPGPIVTGIDAGPGEDEINARLDGSLVTGGARIEQIEEKFEDDMAAFDAAQRAEYERLRGGDDLDAAARMLSEWNRRRREAP